MSLLERDRKTLWHPYTQHGLADFPLPVKAGAGAYLNLENGTKILDAISSWWVNLHGHSHPKLTQALLRQAETLEHVIFSGFTHEPAVKLGEILISAMKERNTAL